MRTEKGPLVGVCVFVGSYVYSKPVLLVLNAQRWFRMPTFISAMALPIVTVAVNAPAPGYAKVYF